MLAKRNIIIIFFLIVLAGAWTVILVNAETTGTCGDRIVQTPNGENPQKWERCDDGPAGSDLCTSTCDSKILGWAWADSIGWISLSNLSCKPDYVAEAQEQFCPLSGISYGVSVSSDQPGTVTGYAWSDNVGWICFGSTCAANPPVGPASVTLDFNGNDDDNLPLQGWAKIISLGNDGWLSLNCTNDPTGCSTASFNVTFSQGSFNATTSGKTLAGWGWNANSTVSGPSDDYGIGWVSFSPTIGGVLPWLQTKFGDIYSRGNITGNPAPSTAFNATYRILAGGGVTQFTSFFSGSGGNAWISPQFGPIDFPTPDTRFSNVLGNLSVDKLIADKDVTLTSSSLIINQGQLPSMLNGKIYYRNGDLTINPLVSGAASEFINGTGFENGSGTIIVKGNLIINTDIKYNDSGSPNRFRNLASVAWIVLGDLQVNGSVKELAGNFIVLGNGTDCDAAGCGQIFSCAGGVNCTNSLTNSGLMMAKKFNFGRDNDTQASQVAAEIIIYDGRLLANTPPGLTDFAQALPIWRAGTFER